VTLHATSKIFSPHSTNDKGHENKNRYAKSDRGEPTAVNSVSYVRTHAQSDNERETVDDPSQVDNGWS
jgi:hypothetical protein